MVCRGQWSLARSLGQECASRKQWRHQQRISPAAWTSYPRPAGACVNLRRRVEPFAKMPPSCLLNNDDLAPALRVNNASINIRDCVFCFVNLAVHIHSCLTREGISLILTRINGPFARFFVTAIFAPWLGRRRESAGKWFSVERGGVVGVLGYLVSTAAGRTGQPSAIVPHGRHPAGCAALAAARSRPRTNQSGFA